MLRQLTKSLVMLSFLAPWVAPAQFAGFDDFNDNMIDASKWVRWYPEQQDALFVETNNRLEFYRPDVFCYSNCPTDISDVLLWIPEINMASNWLAQVDIRVPYRSLTSTQEVEIGLGVGKEVAGTSPANSLLIYKVRTEPNGTGLRQFGRFQSNMRPRGGGDAEEADRSQTEVVSSLASLRLRWDATYRTLTAEYDPNGPMDGFQWTMLSSRNWSDYGLTNLSGWHVMLYGRAENVRPPTEGFPGPSPFMFDNFRTAYYAGASTPAVSLSPPVIKGSSASTSFQSANGRSYTLETKNTLEALDWRPVQSVIGDGSIKTLVDSLTGGQEGYYRLRSP